MRRWILVLLLAVPGFAQQDDRPFTIANDASCDIGTLPAATLLIPYFELEPDADVRRGTLRRRFRRDVAAQRLFSGAATQRRPQPDPAVKCAELSNALACLFV